jgi:hypothetical protein
LATRFTPATVHAGPCLTSRNGRIHEVAVA